jgi:hypothetical protein
MKIPRMLGFFLLAMLAISLGLSSPVRGDDSARDSLEQVHDLLQKAAWDNDAEAAPSNEKRTELLKQAQDLLKTIPLGGYRGHLMKALGLVKDAIDGIAKGDSDQHVTGYIHDAEDEVRAID